MTATGELYCWGWLTFLDGKPASWVPRRIDLGVIFRSVSIGNDSMCGISDAGDLLCWGHNDFGQLGDGSSEPRFHPAPLADGREYTAISLGSHHACAIERAGAIYCWGRNNRGQLGNGTYQASADGRDPPNPVPVSLMDNYRFVQVDAGRFNTCGVAADDTVYCWGGGASTLGNSGGFCGDYPEWGSYCRPYPLPVE